jgi:hypothetical protein
MPDLTETIATDDTLKALQERAEQIVDGKINERLEHLFSYHAPTPDQIPKYEAIRAGAKAFAKILLENTPGCADQSAALRHLRESVMTANASIALGGRG